MTMFVRGGAIVVAALAAAEPAAAYCRTTTCDPTDPKQDCVDEHSCIKTGHALFWASGCISFDTQKDGSRLRGIPAEVAKEIISDGFRAWMLADCGGGRTPSLDIRTHGFAICDEQQYNADAPNANVWMFRDDEWPHNNLGGHTLALTTVTFNVDNGEIFDVDVEINSIQNELSLSTTSVSNDLVSIITHEAGHFLGLSHSTVQGATMLASYQAGTLDLRTLHADDVAGICAVYPPTDTIDTNACEPRHGFASECQDGSSSDGGGCAVTTPSDTRAAGALGLGALAVFGLFVRRRRIH